MRPSKNQLVLVLVHVLGAASLAAACKSTGSDTPSPAIDGGGPDDAPSTAPDGGPAEPSFGPLDPGFTGAPAGVWTTSGGATLETWVAPGVDPGVARFDPAKIRGVGIVAQTFTTPAYASTAQYALETTGVGVGVHARIDNMTLGDLVLGSTSSKSRICLGERAFGHDVALAFRSRASGTFGGDVASVDLDHVAVVAAPECPAAGTFLSGDFETADGWSIVAPSGIVASGGPSAGRVGHLAVSTGQRAAGLQHAPISFPWKTMARPALRFTASGTADLPVALEIGAELDSAASLALGTVRTVGAPTNSVVCVPEWTKGLTLPFLFEVRQPNDLRNLDYFIDDVSFGSDPSCPEASFVLGGDFEGAGGTATAYWTFANFSLDIGGAPAAQSSGIVTTGDAHGGASHALLSVDTTCADATMSGTITTPPAEPGRGPAMKFWYKTTGAGKLTFRVAADELGGTLPATSSWTQHTLCLDPSAANRPTRVSFGANQPASPCAAQPVEALAIDDVEVTTDPSCATP